MLVRISVDMSKGLHSAYTLHGKHLQSPYLLAQFKHSRVDCPQSTASVVTCVGVWVVTEWLVSCLVPSNLQVITKS